MRKIRKIERVLLASLVLLVVLPCAASAQWVPDGAPVCTELGTQHRAVIVSDGSGGAIIAWEDNRTTPWRIYAQRMDASGLPMWIAGGVLIYDGGGYNYGEPGPRMISDGSGGAIITWEGGASIYAERVNASGITLWGTGQGIFVCSQAASNDDNYNPVIISDGADGAFIAWEAQQGPLYDQWLDVQIERLDGDGNPLWGDGCGTRVGNYKYDQASPSMVLDGSGGVIIAYQNKFGSVDGQWFDIHAARMKDASTLWGALICFAYNHQGPPSIVTDGSGGAVIAWEDDRAPSGTNGTYAQRVDSLDGGIHWDIDGVLMWGHSISTLHRPSMISDGAGGAIIHGSDKGQRVNGSGDLVWGTGGIDIFDVGSYPSIILDGFGGAIFAFEKTDDIFAQRVGGFGNEVWANGGIPICTASGIQEDPLIISNDMFGGGIIVWEDGRDYGVSSEDIYAQRLYTEPCEIEPASLDFGTVEVGGYQDRSFTITARSPLSGTVSESCDHYSIISGGGSFALDFGQVLEVTVRFDPTAGGTHLCTIETGDELCSDVLCTGNGCLSGTIYVYADASGLGDGSSWLNAYTELRDALSLAHICSGISEIWVAEGTYTPTDGILRSEAFMLRNGLALYGGFAGTETLLSERDIGAHPTVLSGEIGAGGIADNSYHVVTANNTNTTAVLDGFIVTGGNADGGGGSLPYGGGMYNYNSYPEIRNVVIKSNTAVTGGGMYNNYSSPVLVNVVFSNNTATSLGGGIYNTNSNPTLINLTFNGNYASIWGGGIYNFVSNAELTNAILWGNMAPAGSEIFNGSGGTVTISYSLIYGCGGSGFGWNPSIGFDGGNNIDADPQFKGTYCPDSPLAVWSSSPAIDAGKNMAVPAGITIDIDGNPRIFGGVVDMGAYEHQGPGTGIEDESLPKVIALRSVYPNPFNPVVTVEFDLDRRRNVQMMIYDVNGKLVRELVDEVRDPGTHKIRWNGRNETGHRVATGIYFLRFQSEDWVSHRKIVLLK